jgi:hypothetical protein
MQNGPLSINVQEIRSENTLVNGKIRWNVTGNHKTPRFPKDVWQWFGTPSQVSKPSFNHVLDLGHRSPEGPGNVMSEGEVQISLNTATTTTTTTKYQNNFYLDLDCLLLWSSSHLLYGDRGPTASSPFGHLGEDVRPQVLGEADTEYLGRREVRLVCCCVCGQPLQRLPGAACKLLSDSKKTVFHPFVLRHYQ